MSADFSAILNRRRDEIEAPKPLPPGTYFGEISKVPSLREVSTKDGPKVILTVHATVLEPGPGVDEDLLEQAGLRRRDGQPRQAALDFWMTPEDDYRYKAFLDSLGIDWTTFIEASESQVGCPVAISFEINTYEDKGGNQVTNTRPKSMVGRK